MLSVCLPPPIGFCIKAKKINSVSSDQKIFCHVSPNWLIVNCKQDVLCFFQKWFTSYSYIKARCVECNIKSCPGSRFSHLSCGSLQLLQIYPGTLGCFDD
ncbi:hypothetical protein ILYODFUR_003050 [Ilyodon furcidens]|uniref:Uncharacterized protein n=1 Tax=Ilyodon furcidens TaxID=33524 RepID=A0ABV0URL4_9TELE